jgi:hypothetical protein
LLYGNVAVTFAGLGTEPAGDVEPLGIGTYTMSTVANRLTGAPVDDQLAAYAWQPGRLGQPT